MINLIPPNSKRSVTIEYWIRVITVWFFIWTLSLLASVAILLPTYFLIDYQVSAYSASARDASEKVASYDSVSKELVRSSQQAGIILTTLKAPTISSYITNLKTMQTDDIDILEISLGRNQEGITPIRVTGVADTRQSLAAFRDRLLEKEHITSVDLPISNLAKDRDIQFSITVTIDNSISI